MSIIVIVWMPVDIRVPVGISVWIPGTSRIVVVGIAIWVICFALIAIIIERIVFRSHDVTWIIGERVSTTPNPTGRKPDLPLIVRLCQANWRY